MANSVDLDQTAPFMNSLTACPGLSGRKLRIFTVIYLITISLSRSLSLSVLGKLDVPYKGCKFKISVVVNIFALLNIFQFSG